MQGDNYNGTTTLDLERERLRDAAYIATLLGIPKATVLQYARQGRLPCVRIGRHVRFIVADVEQAIDGARVQATMPLSAHLAKLHDAWLARQPAVAGERRP